MAALFRLDYQNKTAEFRALQVRVVAVMLLWSHLGDHEVKLHHQADEIKMAVFHYLLLLTSLDVSKKKEKVSRHQPELVNKGMF